MQLITLAKLLFLIAVVFMGVGFYTALAAAYQSDANFGEEYPQDQWKELFCKIMIFLSLICLLCSLGLFVYQILTDLNII
ncbi:hypothetical protein [Acinetobacter sp. Marseille-Q1623]|uniref:hypothetical protein n=1 Tax=Acinetobacter sp. Marseille-Q1623 TaxID=2697501 RepID=UPI00157A4AF7|nr:hypothetical protein [Acinetobacter sp. Marseille-Q1623]